MKPMVTSLSTARRISVKAKLKVVNPGAQVPAVVAAHLNPTNVHIMLLQQNCVFAGTGLSLQRESDRSSTLCSVLSTVSLIFLVILLFFIFIFHMGWFDEKSHAHFRE